MPRFATPTFLALVLTLVLGGCLLGSSKQAYPEAPLTLAEARARWARVGTPSYTLVYERVCLFCVADARGPFRVTVEGGRVMAVAPVGIATRALSAARADSLRTAYGLRVEDAFDLIAAAYARNADIVRVSYDPFLGHPLGLYVDEDGRAGGTTFGLRITGLEPAGVAASPPSN